MKQVGSVFSTAEPWELVAAGYASRGLAVMQPFSESALELAGPAAEGKILDIAAGPGTLALPAARRAREVHAIDFSERMVAQLKSQIETLRFGNVHVQIGDGQNLPFGNGEFDAAFSMFGLMFFPDRPRGYAEMRRVLRPGGVAVVSSWAPVQESSLMKLMFGALQAADPSFATPVRDPNGLENVEVLQRELGDSGLVDVIVHPITRSIQFRGPRELWENMTESSAPLVLLRHRVGEEEWKKRAERSVEFIQRELSDDVRELSTTALLGVGYAPKSNAR